MNKESESLEQLLDEHKKLKEQLSKSFDDIKSCIETLETKKIKLVKKKKKEQALSEA